MPGIHGSEGPNILQVLANLGILSGTNNTGMMEIWGICQITRFCTIRLFLGFSHILSIFKILPKIWRFLRFVIFVEICGIPEMQTICGFDKDGRIYDFRIRPGVMIRNIFNNWNASLTIILFIIIIYKRACHIVGCWLPCTIMWNIINNYASIGNASTQSCKRFMNIQQRWWFPNLNPHLGASSI